MALDCFAPLAMTKFGSRGRLVIAYRKTLHGLLPGPALFYWNIEKAAG